MATLLCKFPLTLNLYLWGFVTQRFSTGVSHEDLKELTIPVTKLFLFSLFIHTKSTPLRGLLSMCAFMSAWHPFHQNLMCEGKLV